VLIIIIIIIGLFNIAAKGWIEQYAINAAGVVLECEEVKSQ